MVIFVSDSGNSVASEKRWQRRYAHDIREVFIFTILVLIF